MKWNIHRKDLLGTVVYNIHRRDYHTGKPSRVGEVVRVEEDRLPLIGIKCDDEIRWMPVQDLTILGVSPTMRVVEL